MTALVLFVVVALMLLGILGIVLPVLPGVGLIYGGILLYAVYFGWETVGVTTLVVLGVAAALSVGIDYLASGMGARKYGGSKWGAWGAVVGGFLGFLFLNVFGLILGIFIGAVVAEMTLSQKDLESSLRVGYGSIIGFLAGTVLKLILGFAMIVTFLIKVWA